MAIKTHKQRANYMSRALRRGVNQNLINARRRARVRLDTLQAFVF